MIPTPIVAPSRCAPVFYHGTRNILNYWANTSGEVSWVIQGDVRPCTRVSQCQHRLITLHNSELKLLQKDPVQTCFQEFLCLEVPTVPSFARLVSTLHLVVAQRNTLCTTTVSPQGG